ncbi:LysM peptidoglycan-binding domain-containing protein [Curtobacterium sp. Leaf261]|uniref:LysM peptidoglycan-binding domain-containing protein n=1 Tax=Curtobacterium sp. Leaf261 TaxID=1736311 RepID=UPI0009EB61DF|nr:LysM peptidoglycan-binding domain-containing protein [Curtobacterium sp. Leaf261]
MSTAMISQRSTTVRTRPAVGPATAAATPKLRLTRRGRVVFTTVAAIPLLIVVALAVLNGGQASAGDGSTSGSPATFQTVTIEPGESLWQVAEEQAPNSDPREFVQDVLTLNNLDGSAVQAGQQIAIPAQYSTSK